MSPKSDLLEAMAVAMWGETADVCALSRIALRAIHDAGYRVVPVEPTREMLMAAEEYRFDDGDAGSVDPETAYHAMLKASPIQPEEGE